MHYICIEEKIREYTQGIFMQILDGKMEDEIYGEGPKSHNQRNG